MKKEVTPDPAPTEEVDVQVLTSTQQKLANEIRRLCQKTHGKDHVVGWEIVLFRACLGRAQIPSVDYASMARLLRLSIDSGGWIMRYNDVEKFVPSDEWAKISRSFEK